MIIQKQLLCTFANSLNYIDVLKEIPNQYTLIDNKIFVFANETNLRELYLTFNVEKNDRNNRFKVLLAYIVRSKRIHYIRSTQ